MTTKRALGWWLVLTSTAWGQPAVPSRHGVEAADAAIGALQASLSSHLMEALGQGGAIAAIAVCRDQAQALTAAVGRDHGVRVGRSSHRLRNAGNAAPAWAEPIVNAAAGRLAAGTERIVVDLGDRVGVLRPIATGALCTQCHGAADRVSSEVSAFLRAAYPDDRAVGFEAGDLRGYFWAEAPKAAFGPVPAASGEQLFREANPRCTVCHAVAGQGNPKGPLDGVGKRLTRDEIKAWIRTPAEMARRLGKNRKPAMVPFPEFSDEELEALVDYLVQLD